jgi:hypothetical protein
VAWATRVLDTVPQHGAWRTAGSRFASTAGEGGCLAGWVHAGCRSCWLTLREVPVAHATGTGVRGRDRRAWLEVSSVGCSCGGQRGGGLLDRQRQPWSPLWVVAVRLPRYTVRDGITLGATVGLSFAVLESAGYAFTALFTMQGLSLQSLVETSVLRGAPPVGHGLWTAVVGGVLFGAAAGAGRVPEPPGPRACVHRHQLGGCCWLTRCSGWPCCAAPSGHSGRQINVQMGLAQRAGPDQPLASSRSSSISWRREVMPSLA